MHRYIRRLLLLLALLASSAPVFAQDCRGYFFATIARAEGQPANDWPAVLGSLPGRGFGVNPKPGEIQPANAPHHGITVMIDAGGHARGRIWLATDAPEVNGWYTHEIQVIADGPTPGSFVWAWQDIGGAPPRACGGSGVPPVVVPPPGPSPELLAALLSALQKLDAIEARLNQVESGMREQTDEVKASLREISARAFPCFSGRVGGFAPVTLCPK